MTWIFLFLTERQKTKHEWIRQSIAIRNFNSYTLYTYKIINAKKSRKMIYNSFDDKTIYTYNFDQKSNWI